MTTTEITSLEELNYIPFLDESGQITTQLQGKIGVYAIFNRDQIMQLVGYSRDIYLSLKQHLVCQPQECYWLKVETINRPNRTILDKIKEAWIAHNGVIPPGNSTHEEQWHQPINVKPAMTAAEIATYEAGGELEQAKLLKKVARRIEAEIKDNLAQRGVQMEMRFNPKLKEQGLLTLK